MGGGKEGGGGGGGMRGGRGSGGLEGGEGVRVTGRERARRGGQARPLEIHVSAPTQQWTKLVKD